MNDDMTDRTLNSTVRTPTDRLVTALSDPDRLFTPAEVAWLMSSAGRWGREADNEPDPLSYAAGVRDGYAQRVAEEEGAYPPPPYLIVQGIRVRGDQAAARAAADADRTQRYAGGPVPVWPATRPDHVPAADISVEVVQSGSTWVWRRA